MDHRVRSSCEFIIPYGAKTLKQAKSNYKSLVDSLQSNISRESEENKFDIIIPFFRPDVDQVGEFIPYRGIVSSKDEYKYIIRLNLSPIKAVMTISYEKVPNISVARTDTDELEKRIAKVLEK